MTPQSLLTQLIKKKDFWHHAVIHARWISNGKGGSCNCEHELMKVSAQIEAIKLLAKTP